MPRKDVWIVVALCAACLATFRWADRADAHVAAQFGRGTPTAAATLPPEEDELPTVTPTGVLTVTMPVTPTTVPQQLPTATPAAPATLRLRFAPNEQAYTGSYQLTLDTPLPDMADRHYRLWLLSREGTALDLGEIDPTGEELIVNGDTDRELLADFDTALVSLEADGPAPTTPTTVVYSGTLPTALLPALRTLYFGEAFAGAGALAGARDQAQVVRSHSRFLVDALADDDMLEARRYTEHVLNVLEGATGEHYADLNRDGLIQNPGDGYGLAVYVNDLNDELDGLGTQVDSLAAAETFRPILRQMTRDLNATQALAVVAVERAFAVFVADSVEAAQVDAGALLTVAQEIEMHVDELFTSGLELVAIDLLPTPFLTDLAEPLPALAPRATPVPAESPADTSPVTETVPITAGPTTAPAGSLRNGYWVNPVDGAEYVYVPGGEFVMGAAAATGVSALEQPAHSVTTTAFWLQRTEVTNGQYARCVDAGACTPPDTTGWDDPAATDLPVAYVDWTQAQAYATWAGGRLPTEAEWEHGCRGDDARPFPWGDAPAAAELANYANQVGATAPAGSYPDGASPYGALDMAGNVWEWTTSLEEAYPYSPEDGREDLDTAGKRIARGGSYYYTHYQMHCFSRFAVPPTTTNDQTGFRVVLPATAVGWVNPVDGAEYVYVPGGEFVMGAAAATGVSALEQPAHTVTTTAFWLQRTEVTNGQYARCVDAGACTPPDTTGWDDPAATDLPVAYVDWTQAQAYATWAGGRLPTEAEWEHGCRGDDARPFPWGDAPAAAELANYANQVGATAPAGSYPDGASPYGALDMAGNVWEWTTSLEEAYPYSPEDGREDLDTAGKRIARGGSYYYTHYQMHCFSRFAVPPTTTNDQTGFRVLVVP